MLSYVFVIIFIINSSPVPRFAFSIKLKPSILFLKYNKYLLLALYSFLSQTPDDNILTVLNGSSL